MEGNPVEADLTVSVVKKGILNSDSENVFNGLVQNILLPE